MEILYKSIGKFRSMFVSICTRGKGTFRPTLHHPICMCSVYNVCVSLEKRREEGKKTSNKLVETYFNHFFSKYGILKNNN